MVVTSKTLTANGWTKKVTQGNWKYSLHAQRTLWFHPKHAKLGTTFAVAASIVRHHLSHPTKETTVKPTEDKLRSVAIEVPTFEALDRKNKERKHAELATRTERLIEAIDHETALRIGWIRGRERQVADLQRLRIMLQNAYESGNKAELDRIYTILNIYETNRTNTTGPILDKLLDKHPAADNSIEEQTITVNVKFTELHPMHYGHHPRR